MPFQNARRALLGVALAATLFPLSASAAYPDRPITMVVPFAAGGPTDTVARALAVSMEKSLGQPVVVENKPSAGGIVAPGEIARATPDGYRILIHHIGMATSPALYRKLAYKPTEDFVHLGLVNAVPMTLVAKPNFPANNLAEAVKYIQAGGKPATGKDVKTIDDGSGNFAKLAAAEFIWMKDLNNLAAAMKLLDFAGKLGLEEPGQWFAPRVLNLLRAQQQKKASKSVWIQGK
ncbi:MAG: hypothetical protein EBR88_04790, partial [Betaproteobacteria bacterium]|nr:hypothetical protein [Betaproteobacteria bacterium]